MLTLMILGGALGAFLVFDAVSDDNDDGGQPADDPSLPSEIEGTDGNDDISGTNGDDLIETGTGEDTVSGRQGDDTIFAGRGSDTVYGGKGDDDLYGEDGNDVVTGDLGDDYISLGLGKDTAHGSDINKLFNDDTFYDALAGLDGDALAESTVAGNDHILAGDGQDEVIDLHGANVINGNAGEDYLVSVDAAGTEQAADIVNGGKDNDEIVADDGDIVSGDDGIDLVSIFVDEIDDEAVTLTDWEDGEEIHITMTSDLFGEDDSADPIIEAIDGENALSITVNGQQVMIVEGVSDPSLVEPFVMVDVLL